MAILKSKPTSPGSRFVIRVKHTDLHKGKPFAQLLEKKKQKQAVETIKAE
jgi:LSU ribosomal protein L2P